MAVQRQSPYIWATLLPRLLTGNSRCEWFVWFKSQDQNWSRNPSDFDHAQWLLSHKELLNDERTRGEYREYSVMTESRNSFRLRGQPHTHVSACELAAEGFDTTTLFG